MAADLLGKRQYGGGYGDGYGNCQYVDAYGRCYNSAWYSWARWLVLGLIIFFAILIFFLFSCVTARRRRRMGYSPYYGTGWAAPRYQAGGGARPQYENQYSAQPYYASQNNAPPAYNQQEYYGRRDGDVELQSPPATYGGYRSGEGDYAAPSGPPPRKGDGVGR